MRRRTRIAVRNAPLPQPHGLAICTPLPRHFWTRGRVVLPPLQEVMHCCIGRRGRNAMFFPCFPNDQCVIGCQETPVHALALRQVVWNQTLDSLPLPSAAPKYTCGMPHWVAFGLTLLPAGDLLKRHRTLAAIPPSFISCRSARGSSTFKAGLSRKVAGAHASARI